LVLVAEPPPLLTVPWASRCQWPLPFQTLWKHVATTWTNPVAAMYTLLPTADWATPVTSSNRWVWVPTPSCWAHRWHAPKKHRAPAGTGGWKQHTQNFREETAPKLAPLHPWNSCCLAQQVT